VTSNQPEPSVLRRHFVAIATSTYDDYPELPIAKEINQLEQWLGDPRLAERGFCRAFAELAANPDEDQLRAAFRRPQRPWTARDAAVVFVTGHGEVADGAHWLVLRDSERGDLPNTALRTADFIRWLRRPSGVEHLLLIIDACFAGALAADTVRFDHDFPQSWLIVPSASRQGEATTGALSEAMTKAVAKLRGGEGEKHGTNRRYFRVSDFIDTVREFLPVQDVQPLYRGNWNAEHLCLPNPHFAKSRTVTTQPHRRELALPQADLDTHWSPRATGSDHAKWLFTGRADLMRELIKIISRDHLMLSTPRVTLITGGAGCGKSAVLARLVTLSDPDFLAAHRDQVAEIPPKLRPQEADVNVAVLATGKYPHEVVGQVSDAIGAQRPEHIRGDADLDSRITACVATLDRRWGSGSFTTVVLDALDEAEDPIGIARVLAQLTASASLRLLIGVRSPAGPDDPLTAAGPAGSLADQVERMFTARRLRADHDEWWRQNDIRDYAASILRHTPDSPYRDPGRHAVADELAGVIAESVGRSFLVARLTATALTQRHEIVDPHDPAWRATLDEGVVGAFRADLVRVFSEPERRLNTVELLRAVAFAYGRGLPWGKIWPVVANAIADRYGKYGDRDIAELLASPMSAYLITDQEDGITVYRLFHEALRDTLRNRHHDLLRANST
jgi:hypothetical protein